MPRKILSISKLDGHFKANWLDCEVKNVVKDFSKSKSNESEYPIGFIGCECDLIDHQGKILHVTFYCVKISKG